MPTWRDQVLCALPLVIALLSLAIGLLVGDLELFAIVTLMACGLFLTLFGLSLLSSATLMDWIQMLTWAKRLNAAANNAEGLRKIEEDAQRQRTWIARALIAIGLLMIGVNILAFV